MQDKRDAYKEFKAECLCSGDGTKKGGKREAKERRTEMKERGEWMA